MTLEELGDQLTLGLDALGVGYAHDTTSVDALESDLATALQTGGDGLAAVPRSAGANEVLDEVDSVAAALFSPARLARNKERMQRARLLRAQFLEAVRNNPITNPDALPVGDPRAFISVDPVVASVAKGGKLELVVRLRTTVDTTLNGVLVCQSSIHERVRDVIPIQLQSRAAEVVVDDSRTLNFGCLPVGESQTLTRVFSNLGAIDVVYHIRNDNLGLTAAPRAGLLAAGASVRVAFTFRPMIKHRTATGAGGAGSSSAAAAPRARAKGQALAGFTCQPVSFETDSTAPIVLNMFGEGGECILTLANRKQFDFGRCMINYPSVQHLRLGNKGTAVLHIRRFELDPSNVFLKPENAWPAGRVQIKPNAYYDLPLCFYPANENPLPGRLTIYTAQETLQLELVGSGRNAVLAISKTVLSLTECIVGNTYHEVVDFTNAGDVNYPLEFSILEDGASVARDIAFRPPSAVLLPFEKLRMHMAYKPRWVEWGRVCVCQGRGGCYFVFSFRARG